MYPIATLLEAGVVVSFGSDWPVSDPNPLHGLYQAITRQDAPEQGLAVPEAIRCYSQNGALQIGLEAPLGIAGSTWVEWDVDLVNASPTELVNARVIRHSVNGVVTKP
jgi:predicted amidohydrolase YtcJ